MTEGGCKGEEEGSNCDDVAVGAGAGAAGFMMIWLVWYQGKDQLGPRTGHWVG